MATNDDDADKKAKDVLAGELDAQTQADLARWFGLPSFDEVAARGGSTPEMDEAMLQRRERQEKAIEAIDPALVEAHRRRTTPPDDLIKFKATIDVLVDPSIAKLDVAIVAAAIAEPREVERPEDLQDALKECTPQALLRDLHRAELDFEKTFEVVDMVAEQRIDAIAERMAVMATRWTPDVSGEGPWSQATTIVKDTRRILHQPWAAQINELPGLRRRWRPEEDR